MPVVTLLNAVSANTTGPVVGLGTPTGTLTVSVTTAGTVSGLSVVVQGSNDSVNWENIGPAVTSVTAGTSIGTGVLLQYYQALLSGYSGSGTVTCRLAYSLGAGAGGLPPPTGVTAGSYTNAGITVGADGRLTAASSGSASGMANPMTAAGDLIDGGAGGTPARLAGNTSATKNFLTQTGNGTISAAPGWGTIASGDVPNNAANTTGTAAGLSATLAVASGGTNATTAAAALTSLGAAPIAGATFTGWVAPAVVSLTDASTVTVNAALGNDFRLTMTSGVGSTRALGAPSNPVDGQKIILQVTQDSSGSQLLTYASGSGGYEFGTGLTSPTLSTGANYTDLLGFVYNATKSKWLFVAFVAGF